MNIGDAARRSGCSVSSIRYYEEIGLLRPALRSAAGRRVYLMPDVTRMRLIRRLRTMEFSLDAVRTFLDAVANDSCLRVRDLAREHLEVVSARRAEIDALERTLRGLAAACSDDCAGDAATDCTIMDDFARIGA